MNARPPRHRVTPQAARGFWAAKELLSPSDSSNAPKHARTDTPRYAVCVGRVGALAVSLGIGFAVVSSAVGVAAAESDTDSGAESSSTSTEAVGTPSSQKAGGEGADASTADGDTDDSGDGMGDADDPDPDDLEVGESDLDEADPDEIDEADRGADLEVSDGSDAPRTGGVVVQLQESPDADGADGVDDVEGPEADAVLDVSDTVLDDTRADSGETLEVVDAPLIGAPERRTVTTLARTHVAAEPVETVNLVSAAVSNVIAPLVDTDAPVSSPVTDILLAYVRRIINHTFFNKTPVVRSVTTEQIITGQVLITIDAYDPNGDPLTYEIVQPQGGLVFREPLTGTFVYTPNAPVFGKPVPVEFSVVIRDDSEHLTGTLGDIQSLLEGVARTFGLAQADNITQTVSFDVGPIVHVPPTVIALGNLPYTLGKEPVRLLSVAEIRDADSATMKSAKVKIELGRQAGDTLDYVAPVDNPIIGNWNGTDTLTLTGLATKAQYEEALKAITFSATDLGLLARTVSIDVTDDSGVSALLPATVLVGVKSPDRPTIAVVGATFPTVGDTVRPISSATIFDTDSDVLTAASVVISSNLKSGDTLTYTPIPGNPITASYAGGTLTLSGTATIAQYKQALEAITFKATQFGGGFLALVVVRTLTINVTDDSNLNALLPGLAFVTVSR